MEATVEEKKPKVKTVIIKFIAQHIYRGDDNELGNKTLTIHPNTTVTISEKKALQVTRDFPEMWELVSAEDPVTGEILVKNIIEGQLRKNQARQQSFVKKVTGEGEQTVSGTPFTKFLKNLKEGKVGVVKISVKELLTIVRSAEYVGLNAYVHLTKSIEKEIGANQRQNVRYVLVSESKKNVVQEKEEPVQEKEEETKEPVTEDQIPVVVAGKDRDIEEVSSSGFDDLDNDLDEEDKHKSKGIKKAKKLDPDDED